MKSIISIAVAGTLFLLVLVNLALTETAPVFQDIDVNHDGRVTQEEFAEEMKESGFSEIDKDGSKGISLSEWDSIDHVKGNEEDKKVFESIDKNHDKRITFPEFSSYSDKHSNIEREFIIRDKDKDGSLSMDEMSTPPVYRMIRIPFGKSKE
jgi:Ca2+-binding EF-hand superfamily protein